MTDSRPSHPDPRDPRPEPREHVHGADADPEPDPTGVRAILAALPEPGPMPADLVRRITTSLAAEQIDAAHNGNDTRDEGAGWHRNGAPTRGSSHRSPRRAPVRAGTDSADDSHEMARERRRSIGARLPSLAIAASVVVLAGVVVLGMLGMLGINGFSTTSSDSAAGGASDTAADSAVREESDDSGGGEGADADADLDGVPMSAQTDENGQPLVGAATPFLATGALVTRSTFVEHARALHERTVLDHSSAAERTMAGSAVGTVDGAAECLSRLMGIAAAEARERLDAVDFVRFGGEPAALILVREHSDDAGAATDPAAEALAGSTAYLVPVDCDRDSASTLLEPARVDP